MYEVENARTGAPDGWVMTCLTVRSDDQFLTTAWIRALQRVLELSFSDLPFGRSWKIRLENLDDAQIAQEIENVFMETILYAGSLLAREFSKSVAENRNQVNLTAVEAASSLLDYTRPLYNYVPTTRIKNSAGQWVYPQNEGFTSAHAAVLDQFIRETNNCEVVAVLLQKSGDIQQITKLINILTAMKQKRELPTLDWLIECACVGLEFAATKSSALTSKNLLRDAVEEIMRLSETDLTVRGSFTSNAGSSLPVESWKKVALGWFNSDKLKLRRAGLEQLGEVSKHMILNCGSSRQAVTEWLRRERVFEITFSERFDERVIPCVEELLLQLEMNQSMINLMLQRAGSKAVQKVLGNVCLHSAFSETTSARLLAGAARALILNKDEDAGSLLMAALSESKQTRLNLVRKGRRSALAVVRALVALLVIGCNGETEETQTSDALYLVCLEMEAKNLKRYAIDMLMSTFLPSEAFLPDSVRSRMDDMETMYGIFPEDTSTDDGILSVEPFPLLIRTGVNREAAYRALRRLLSSYPLAGVGYSSSFTQMYQEYCSRSDCLRSLEEEWSFRDLFFSDLDVNCKTEKGFKPRLDLLSFVLRFSPNPGDLTQAELSKLWEKARVLSAQETFCFWLESCANRECNPCISTECLRSALECLLTKEELRRGENRTYMCMQTLFIEVNAAYSLIEANQQHEEGSREHRQSHPSSDKTGAKLIGKRVSVLHSDGRMQQGMVTAYKDTWGKHVIEYFTGTVEEKPMDELNEWWLLPAPDATRAGTIEVSKVRKGEKLIGLENIWIMALESQSETVSDRAADLLVALHRRSMSETFIDRTYDELRDAHAALTNTNRKPEPELEVEMADDPMQGIDFNRSAMRCIELLRSLDVCTRVGLSSTNQRIVSHGHRSRGLPVKVVVDMNQPTTGSDVAMVTSTVFDVSHNTFVDEFATRVCASAPSITGGQISIDPQSDMTSGGLGVPTAPGETGADFCTLEEIGVLPGSLGTRATFGSKSSSVIYGPKRQGEHSNSLAIVPYEYDSVSPPPLSVSNSPIAVGPVSPEYSYSGSQSPSPPPHLAWPQQRETMDVEDAATAEPEPGVAQLATQSKSLVNWSYPEEQYLVLFSLLEPSCRSSAELKRAIWEFLQSIPTCALDEELAVNTETAVCDSYWRSLYRLQIIGFRFPEFDNATVLSTSETQEFVRLVEQTLSIMLSESKQAVVVLSSMSSVLLWGVESAVRSESFPADMFCEQLSSLLLIAAEALRTSSESASQVRHECVREKRPAPPARLCEDCFRTRAIIRGSVELLEALQLTLQKGGEALCSSFFPSRLARDLIWNVLVTHSVATVRETFQVVFKGINSKELLEGLIHCESRLEESEPSTSLTCDQFFEMLTERVPNIERQKAEAMFSRISDLLFNWRIRRRSQGEDFPDPALFACFAKLLMNLVPLSISNDSIDSVVKSWVEHFLLNTSDIGIVQNEQVRGAVSSVVSALIVKASGTSEFTVLHAIDEFLTATPIPLRRQDKGWGFEIDWSVDPSASDGTGLRIKSTGTRDMGLLNRGSTCYANSVLQMLFSVAPFREAILNAKVPAKKEEMAMSVAMQTTVRSAPTPSPPPPPPKQKQSVAKAWQCWCTGVNDLSATTCRICEMPRPDDYEIISESFSFAMPSELMMQVQHAEEEEQEQLTQFQRSVSGASANSGKEEHNVEILRQIQRAFAFLYFGRQSWYDPYKLIMASKPLNLQFPVTSQNDASEYYDKLLDALDQSLKREGNDAEAETLKSCFLGKQVKLKRCQVCENVSLSKDEEFYRLELMVKNESETKNELRECLDAFTAPEDMFGDNKVDCDICQTRTNTTFVTCLTEVPRYLFIHPKRFTYDLDSNQTVKLNHFISFPEELDLFPYTKDGIVFTQQQQQVATGPGGDDDMMISRPPSAAPFAFASPDSVKHQHLWYDLKGVLVHRGRAGGGHYYAFVDTGVGTNEQRANAQSWVHFNDDRVSNFDLSKLAEECFGGRVERSNTDQWGISRTETIDNEKSAFMLLYVGREKEVERDHTSSKVMTGDEVLVRTSQWPLASTAEDAVMLDLSEADLFNPDDSLVKDKSLSSIPDDMDEEEIDRTKLSTTAVSVPKPIAAFSRMTSIENSALARAKQLQQENLLRMIEPENSQKEDQKPFRALKREVDDASLALLRQTLLFSPVTAQLLFEVLADCNRQAPSHLLLSPLYTFFFQVVCKSRHTTDIVCRRWLTQLHDLIVRASFERRTAFADTLLSSWIQAPETSTFDTEIAPVNSHTIYFLPETLLDCTEKRVRQFTLEGCRVLLHYLSQVTLNALVRATLMRFEFRYPEQQTNTKQKVYLEALVGLLDRLMSGATGAKTIILESGCVDGVVRALITPSSSQPHLMPSLELVESCCTFIAEFLPPQFALSASSPGAYECLSSSGLRNVLLEVGLSTPVVPEPVLNVLFEHVKLVCASSYAEAEFSALVEKLLELIHLESSSTSASSSQQVMAELPYDATIVTNVLGSDSSKASFLGRALLIAGSVRGSLMGAATRRVVQATHQAIMSPQVHECLSKGSAMQLSLPKHSTWEEKLFPLDGTVIRYACRLISCLVQSVIVGVKAMPQAEEFKDWMSTNTEWSRVCQWFLATSSSWNQMAHANGLDNEAVRKLRRDLTDCITEGFGNLRTEEAAKQLIGSSAEEICLQVEGAGFTAVNGTYRYQLPEIQNHPRWMSETGLSIYRCALSNGSEEWFLSKLEPGLHPSDEHNTDFYSTSPVSKTCQCKVPHPAEWNTLAKGRPPAPMVRKVLVKDLPPPPPPSGESTTEKVEDEDPETTVIAQERDLDEIRSKNVEENDQLVEDSDVHLLSTAVVSTSVLAAGNGAIESAQPELSPKSLSNEEIDDLLRAPLDSTQW